MDRGRIGLFAGMAALAAAALVGAGCGSGGALSLDPVAAAATKTQNAGVARVRYSMTFSGQGHSFALAGKGVVDGTSADLTVGLGSLIRRMGIPKGASPGVTMSQLMHASIEEVMLKQGGDYVIYVHLPSFLGSKIPGGKQWIEMNLSKLGSAQGINFGQLMSGSGFEPTDMLGMLKSEGATVTKAGTATIGGVATTHYAVKIDVAKAYRSKGLTSPLFQKLLAKMPAAIPADVWIDKNSLVRRVGFSMSTRQVSMRMSMDLYDYGTNAKIAAPASNDVFDMTSLIASGTGSGSGG